MILQLLKAFRFQLLRLVAADCTKISLRARGQRGLGAENWQVLERLGHSSPAAASSSQPGVPGLRGTRFHFPPAPHTTPVVPTQEKVKSGSEG